MRLRNIPGAKDAILDCEWVIDEPERFSQGCLPDYLMPDRPENTLSGQ